MTFEDLHLGSILVSTVRNAPVLIFAAMLFPVKPGDLAHQPRCATEAISTRQSGFTRSAFTQ